MNGEQRSEIGMSDMELSAITPINNPKHRNMPEGRRCVAHKKTGERCQRPALLGGSVCFHHGGAANHVRRAAKARLDNAADRLAKLLLGMTTDENIPPAVKLAAIKDALDRAGFTPKQALEVTQELKPWENLMEDIHKGGPMDPDQMIDLMNEAAQHPGDDRFGPTDEELERAGFQRIGRPMVVEGEVVEDDPYRDNPLQSDGLVHCVECDDEFPGLDALHAAGLTRYPRVCRPCREEIRAEQAEDRAVDEQIGTATVAGRPTPSVRPPARTAPAPAPRVDRTPGRNPRYPLPPQGNRER